MAERFPNQSRIIVVKDEHCDKGEHYAFLIQSQAEKAMKKLTSTGFALWFYIAQNNNNHDFYLSSKDFCNWSGLSRKTYTTYLTKMKDLGFLVPIEDDKNNYYFYADPDKINIKRDDDCTIVYDTEEYQSHYEDFKKEFKF